MPRATLLSLVALLGLAVAPSVSQASVTVKPFAGVGSRWFVERLTVEAPTTVTVTTRSTSSDEMQVLLVWLVDASGKPFFYEGRAVWEGLRASSSAIISGPHGVRAEVSADAGPQPREPQVVRVPFDAPGRYALVVIAGGPGRRSFTGTIEGIFAPAGGDSGPAMVKTLREFERGGIAAVRSAGVSAQHSLHASMRLEVTGQLFGTFTTTSEAGTVDLSYEHNGIPAAGSPPYVFCGSGGWGDCEESPAGDYDFLVDTDLAVNSETWVAAADVPA